MAPLKVWKCQRKPVVRGDFVIHEIEAPDEPSARGIMFTRSWWKAWLDPSKTDVWSDQMDGDISIGIGAGSEPPPSQGATAEPR